MQRTERHGETARKKNRDRDREIEIPKLDLKQKECSSVRVHCIKEAGLPVIRLKQHTRIGRQRGGAGTSLEVSAHETELNFGLLKKTREEGRKEEEERIFY